jgi:hypothetical protein
MTSTYVFIYTPYYAYQEGDIIHKLYMPRIWKVAFTCCVQNWRYINSNVFLKRNPNHVQNANDKYR